MLSMQAVCHVCHRIHIAFAMLGSLTSHLYCRWRRMNLRLLCKGAGTLLLTKLLQMRWFYWTLSFYTHLYGCTPSSAHTRGHLSISHAHTWWLVERESYNISNSPCPCYHTSFVYSITQIFTIGIIIILIRSFINCFPRKRIQPQLLLKRRKWSYCCKNWKEIWRKHAMKRTKHCENWPVSSSICWKRLLS